MSGSRTVQVGADRWQELQRRVRARGSDGMADGAADDVAGVLAQHLDAPVRALLVTTAGGHGVRTRLTLTGGRAVLVAQRLAVAAGTTRVEPGAQITFTGTDDLWGTVARTLPEREALRAPASAVVGEARHLRLPRDEAERLLEREACNVRVQVEAWRGGRHPVVVWGRLWSLTGDRLVDVRVDDGDLDLVERPAGSLAKELRWALTGALSATREAGAGA